MSYYYIKSSIKMTNLTIAYNLGGLFDQDGQKGISHLMEHLICKTFKDEYNTLSRYNIEWNASTGDSLVQIYFTGLDKYLTPDLKKRLVNKILGGINIPEKEFEAEKKVVLEEYEDSFNEPANIDNALREKFGYYGPIGKREDIIKFTYKDMKKYYDKYLKKPAKIIEVGPTKTDFSNIPMNETFINQPIKPKFKKNWKIELEPEPQNNKCDVSFICKKAINKSDYPALAVALNMLASGLDSPMMKEIREKRHLTYHVGSSTLKFMNYAYLTFGAATKKENKNKLIDSFKMFTDDVEKFLKKKRFEEIICKINVDRETAKIFKYKNVNKILTKGQIQIGNAYKKLTFDKVVEIAKKYIITKNFDISVK